jgi:ABC-type multidrug transport system fused ATPase/permease subunit
MSVANNSAPSYIHAGLDGHAPGRIVFDGVTARYRPGLPHVIKDLSFVVEPGQSVGLCGRTGSGKSIHGR